MSDETYGVGVVRAVRPMPAPELAYRPPVPSDTSVGIGLIGCGGITQSHLQAYKKAGFRVVALASRSRERAEARRAEFFPEAAVFTDWRELLARDDVRVADIATSPEVRGPIIEAALRAGKHVLSQKPLALTLAEGERLVALAEQLGRRLAVNQNGRWAPHFAWMREAISAGLVGEVSSVDFTLHWDHHWICGSPFEELKQLVLGDFAIHWFDIATAFFGDRRAHRVFAAAARSRSQRARPPFLAHACAEFDGGQATFAFNADAAFGQEDRTTIVGARGTLRSVGPGLMEQRVTLHTADGLASPELEGCWFPDGFHGAMAELLCAVEENRAPLNSARVNLHSLALCLAAVQSAETGQVVAVDGGGAGVVSAAMNQCAARASR
ncbi:MAG: Gfo/Idh/MocA family oxidoreductase [Chthoniobacter sp.]|nr:Gfo/Idh/MocA family oxidoreductase [Chthoniobacter sp.]